MKSLRIPFLVVATLGVISAAPAATAAPVYELRTYTAAPGKMADMLARFRNHTVKLFARHGMVNVGYWIPADEKDGAGSKLVYLLEHKSREAAAASWKAFIADPEWKDVQKKSEANGRIVAKLETLFLAATDFSKPMNAGAGKGQRVFELRTYVAPEGKLADLDARFRNHTVALFAKHGMTNLGYFHPTDADKGAGNTLIYFLAYPSREAAAASWKGFREDPVWAKAKEASEKNGRLTTKVESVYFTAADFSAIK
ncbi:MAG: NIPSNAP family protein [Opitutaceae bacterium]|nr:NIPSNAP family protein [Opitutaceae bacterium]